MSSAPRPRFALRIELLVDDTFFTDAPPCGRALYNCWHTLEAKVERARPSPAALSPEQLAILADHVLLERFVQQREETAFALLVRRHGPMVRATCRRCLGDTPDLDDAFQAVFLVLARKAGSIRRRD